MVRLFVLSILLIALPSCSLRQLPAYKHTTVEITVPTHEPLLLTLEERARMNDIPFPLGVTPIKVYDAEGSAVLSYTSCMTAAEIKTFYHTEMEYAGWEELGSIVAQESCLIYSKPSKLCTITFGSPKGQMAVVSFITPKIKIKRAS